MTSQTGLNKCSGVICQMTSLSVTHASDLHQWRCI